MKKFLLGITFVFALGCTQVMAQDVKEVKKKINYLLNDTSYMSTNYWGYVCDNMYEMMKNKARSIIRKVGNQPSK